MSKARAKTVFLITPGGLSAPGGIVRMTRYCTRAWPPQSPFVLRVIDTYGPGPKWLMPFFALRAFAMTLILLAMGRAQLLHINLSERLSLWRKGAFVILAQCFGVPVILHLHGAEFADTIRAGGPLRKRFAKALLGRAKRLIVLGSYWQEFIVGEMGIPRERVTILCNAVPDLGMRKPESALAECRLLFLGVVGERKGVPALLEALATPEMAGKPWRMIVAGNGELERFRKQAQALGIAASVNFTGLLTEYQARAELGQANIFVLPSRQEGLPMAILEALSYGCAVVATPVGSVPDAVIDGVTGLLVPVGDAATLGKALARLIADTALRERLGRQGRALFEEKFAITAYNEALEAIYKEVAR